MNVANNEDRTSTHGLFYSKVELKAAMRGCRITMRSSAWLSTLLVALAGCSSTPLYAPPPFEVPARFKEDGAQFQRADPARAAAAIPEHWWLLFNDPALDNLQAQALLGNANLQASAAAVRIAQAAVQSSRAALFPTIGIGAGVTRSQSAVAGTTVSGGVARPVTSYSVQALVSNWEIDLWNRLGAQVDSARARLAASSADLSAARLSLHATVAQTYFSLRAAEAQIALLDRTVQGFSRSAQLTQNRYAAGIVSAADVAQAQAQLKSAQAQRVEARLNRAQLEHALASLTGTPPAAFGLSATAVLPTPPPVPEQLPSTLLERRPDIAAAERRVAAANAQIGAADAAFFPAITLSASTGFRSLTLGNLVQSASNFWSIGPSLLWAGFDGGARRAASDSARAAYDQTVATYRQTVLVALQEVEDNLIAASALAEEVTIQQQALAAANKAQEVTLNQYEAGIVSFINVVTAQATVLSAETTLLNLQTRRLAAANTLLKNIGGRWEAAPAAGAASR